MRPFYRLLLCLTGLVSANASFALPPDSGELRVFIDCAGCDRTFIKSQITRVQYVRDRQAADLHLFINVLYLGTGAQRYELQLIDRREGGSVGLRLGFDVSPAATDREVDQQLLRYLRAGLLPYLLERHPELAVSWSQPEEEGQAEARLPPEDPWNFWVFEVSGEMDWEKESQQSEYELEGEIDLERTTEEWRVRSEWSLRYQLNRVVNQGQVYESQVRNQEADASVVKTLGPRSGLGLIGRIGTNTFNNIRLGSRWEAAYEYNFFPYRQASTREFTLTYALGPRHYRYFEETIYGQTEEWRMSHSLRLNLDLRQVWGRVELGLSGQQFWHDPSRYWLNGEAEVSLRLFKGLLVYFGTEASLVRNQLFLPRENASLQEVLLRQRAIATNYELDFSVGFSYTFGSVYNSIINPRL